MYTNTYTHLSHHLNLNLLHLIQLTFFPPPPLSFLPPLLSLLLTDQGSVCGVSISHASFLPSSPTLIQGQGLPSSHFPSLREHGCSGWPYLLSLLSQTLPSGAPLIAFQPLQSPPLLPAHSHVQVYLPYTHMYSWTLKTAGLKLTQFILVTQWWVKWVEIWHDYVIMLKLAKSGLKNTTQILGYQYCFC